MESNGADNEVLVRACRRFADRFRTAEFFALTGLPNLIVGLMVHIVRARSQRLHDAWLLSSRIHRSFCPRHLSQAERFEVVPSTLVAAASKSERGETSMLSEGVRLQKRAYQTNLAREPSD